MLGCLCNNLFQTGYKQVFARPRGEVHRQVPVLIAAGKEEEIFLDATRHQNAFKERETPRESIT
jgi:hypothetical protein